MEKRWKYIQTDEQAVSDLQDSLKINKTLCRILIQRGLDDFEKSKHFFRPELSDLHSPWLMKDMKLAVDRILKAIHHNENILVYGDYDVDGTTSVASMFQFLKKLYNNVDYYIPHRYREGYGISKQGIDFAYQNQLSLIISLDCGIKSSELIAYASSLGIDFIVCDHHLPDHQLPKAVAILNPKQSGCSYPYKELCGCGVGFKLMQAITETLDLAASQYLDYLDLVATAIAADIVPLTGENRVMAFYGLKKVNENPCPGIKAIMQMSGMLSEMKITNLIYMIAPRINAAGRMDDARKAVQLFIEQDAEKAKEFAKMLQEDNTERKVADSSITEEALQLIETDKERFSRKSTVVYREHWHKGVVGIVASRLIEHYYRPTVVLTKSGDFVTGSARSVAGFNLYEAIHACREYLIGYGGHFAAAGLTMLPENVEKFKASFERIVASIITPESLIPEITIESPVLFSELTDGFYRILCQMEPFGPENGKPVFVAENVLDTGYSKIVKENHIRFVVKQGNHSFTGIGFNLVSKFGILLSKQPMDILFNLDMNEWNGEKNLQLQVLDIRPCK